MLVSLSLSFLLLLYSPKRLLCCSFYEVTMIGPIKTHPFPLSEDATTDVGSETLWQFVLKLSHVDIVLFIVLPFSCLGSIVPKMEACPFSLIAARGGWRREAPCRERCCSDLEIAPVVIYKHNDGHPPSRMERA
jgi:hypothetical protein